MSWNNGYETKLNKLKQKKRNEYYRENSMTKKQIEEINKYDYRQYLDNRYLHKKIDVIYPFTYDDDDLQFVKIEEFTAIVVENFNQCADRFNDERLNHIIKKADVIDKQIIKLLSLGKTFENVAKMIGISQCAVSKRVDKFRKIKIF